MDIAIELLPKIAEEAEFRKCCDRRRYAAREQGKSFRSSFDWIFRQEALACYNTVVGSATTNVVALFNRGNALEELGFFAEAIADWTAAVALEPDCGDAHYNLARALSRDGRRREALRHWTKYLALDRTSAWASRARRERKRLLKLEALQIISRKIA